MEMSLAAVSMKTALKYRRNWNKNAPIVKRLQEFMPSGAGAKKGYRLYIELGEHKHVHFTVPPAVRAAVRKAGFVITDYLAKKCVKLDDKDQKNVFNIGKVIAKDAHAKAAFDNDPQLQSTKEKLQVVISCHPYDIIGMSTGRSWDTTSCMRLDDGVSNVGNTHQNSGYIKHDVAEGTMVAYVVKTGDTNIQTPISRILLKPYINKEKGIVVYRREGRAYGANVPAFNSTLEKFLLRFNKDAPEATYTMPSNLYDDTGRGSEFDHSKNPVPKTFIEILNQPEYAVDYIKARIDEIGKLNMDNKHDKQQAATIFKSVSDVLKQVELHDTQIDEITELMEHTDVFMDAYHSDLMNFNHSEISPNYRRILLRDAERGGQLLEKSKTFFGLDDENAETFGIEIASRFTVSGGKGTKTMLKMLEKECAQHNIAPMRRTITEWVTGARHMPSAEEWDEVPLLRDFMFSYMSAMRYRHLFVKQPQTGVYEFLEVVTNAKKLDQDSLDIWAGSFRDADLMCYILDNEENLPDSFTFNLEVGTAMSYLESRRAYRAMDKIKDPRVVKKMDRIKLEMIRNTLAYSSTNYRDHYHLLHDWLDAEVGQRLHDLHLDPRMVGRLLSLWPDIAMKIDVAQDPRSSTEVVSQIISNVKNFKGVYTPPPSSLMLFYCRTAALAARMIDGAPDVAAKFELGDYDLDDIQRIYNGNRPFNSDEAYGFIDYFGSISWENRFPDIARNQKIFRHNMPNSLNYVKGANSVKNADQMLRILRSSTAASTLVRNVDILVDNLFPQMTTNVDEYVDEEIMLDGAERDNNPELYDSTVAMLRERVTKQNAEILQLNAAMLETAKKYAGVLGENADEVLERFPNFGEYEMAVIDAKRDELKEAIASYEEAVKDAVETAQQ